MMNIIIHIEFSETQKHLKTLTTFGTYIKIFSTISKFGFSNLDCCFLPLQTKYNGRVISLIIKTQQKVHIVGLKTLV